MGGMDLAKHERQEKEAAEFNERAHATGWDMVTEKVKNFSIIARQRRDRERLEHTEHELGNLGGRLTKATSEFGAMRESCQEALNMVRTMHNKVAEMGEQQDLTHEYWQGLSRGFRDTHRHIAIEKHLLPVKAATALPSLSPLSPVSLASRAIGEPRHTDLPDRPNSRANRPRTYSVIEDRFVAKTYSRSLVADTDPLWLTSTECSTMRRALLLFFFDDCC